MATKTSDPLNTPVMRQYLELKEQHPGSVMFFRMGDFYEMFLEDAERAAPLMDVALTKRQGIPMAGVPYHSAETYIARLLNLGEKVAIAEQSFDPENPKLMKRQVRRVISPGTVVEESLLDSGSFNYLLAVAELEGRYGLACADISTGDFFALELKGRNGREDGAAGRDRSTGAETPAVEGEIRDYFMKLSPREVIANSGILDQLKEVLPEARGLLAGLEDWRASPLEGCRQIEKRFAKKLGGLGFEDESSPALGAAALILHYVDKSFPHEPVELDAPVYRSVGRRFMALDEQTIRNLDLVYNAQEGGNTRTLLAVLDFCATAPGRRFLKESLLAPFLLKDEILERQERVSTLVTDRELNDALQTELKTVADLERVLSRMSAGRAAPRDFPNVSRSVKAAKRLAERLKKTSLGPVLKNAAGDRKLAELAGEIDERCAEDPPAILGNGPFLREGVFAELDEARAARTEGKNWIVQFEADERTRTGISNLRVKYNKVVGYFIEISKGQAAGAPDDYIRKQTLVNGERYSCERLTELEGKISRADDIIAKFEQEEFRRLTERVTSLRGNIRAMMRALAELDFISSLARAAVRFRWTAPTVVETGEVGVLNGRHPVVEKYLPAGEQFIPNNVNLDAEGASFAILTGPNMAGKSTYIRQVAVIQLLMQIGSYVPAERAILSVVDRIFTRIGAADNLTRGESTFFVEMLETARILNQSTERSLVIMDEVGRGTSTYDGMAIAWSVVEYLTGMAAPRPRVLFATHYHELTVLDFRPGVFNLTMDVREVQGKLIFLHKIKEGPADRSYGIHVAELAGLPAAVIDRATEKLRELEEDTERRVAAAVKEGPRKTRKRPARQEQPGLF